MFNVVYRLHKDCYVFLCVKEGIVKGMYTVLKQTQYFVSPPPSLTHANNSGKKVASPPLDSETNWSKDLQMYLISIENACVKLWVGASSGKSSLTNANIGPECMQLQYQEETIPERGGALQLVG